MQYKHEEFKVNEWFVDVETTNLATELSQSGARIMGKDQPTAQVVVMTLKNKSLPFAWVVFNWWFTSKDLEDKDIIRYSAEDKYQINPFDYNDKGLLDIAKKSFNRFSKEFDRLATMITLEGGMSELDDSEFNFVLSEIKRLLKSKGF